MSDGDAGENRAKCPPDSADLGFGEPERGGANHARREAIEGEGDETAFIAVETTRDVPQRGAEQGSKNEMRNAGEPSPRGEGFGLKASRPEQKWCGGDQVPEGGVVGIESVIVADGRRRAWANQGVHIGNCAGARRIMPTAQTGVEAVPLAEIDFTGL